MPTVEEILGSDAAGLLQHQCKTIAKESLHLPGPDFVERIHLNSNRPVPVLGKLQSLFDHGRLGGTGLRVDPAGRSGHRAFRRRVVCAEPALFRSREHRQARHRRRLQRAWPRRSACSGMCARKYAHKIPFILKFNHNEFISYPNSYDQIRFASVKQGFDMGAAGVGATIYFGSEESKRQIQEVDRDVPARARARHVHRAVVLPAQPGVQDQGRRLSPRRRSHRPGESPRRDDRGRHHQAEAARDQRRLQRDRLRQDATRRSTRICRAIIRSTSRATSSPTATWAAPA